VLSSWPDSAGRLDRAGLQRAYASALGMTVHADATVWRREQLRRHPVPVGIPV